MLYYRRSYSKVTKGKQQFLNATYFTSKASHPMIDNQGKVRYLSKKNISSSLVTRYSRYAIIT